jgi:hypothetical protein
LQEAERPVLSGCAANLSHKVMVWTTGGRCHEARACMRWPAKAQLLFVFFFFPVKLGTLSCLDHANNYPI